ncbi:hypothetical protein NGA74_02100 [Lactobacillus helveticus]|uniref:hypothetical protein n=1 Tax=Lactobacillus helveticus TaxID=1587 RepID=UPI00207CD6D4|nr:hypothetical protein [Lactobacillus helveticus]MCO0806753.1 hypothetical protein [Lactobacillus helveticus]
MTKYLINDSDFVRIGQKLYRIDPNGYESDYLTSKNASKDYENRLIENGVDAEIFRNGNDQKTTALMQGDIVASKLQPELAFILISIQLMPLNEAKYALDAYKEASSPNVVNLPSPEPSEKEKQEFSKRDNQMAKDIDTLKALVDNAENQGWETIDGVNYGASHTWREVAQLALDLADQQEWFNRYDNKYFN